ncbi:MAG: hypothetical protein WA990_08640 [Rubrobacteraceae bacterium]
MKPARHPATIILGMFALIGLIIGLIGGYCGNTFLEQVFSVTAVPVALVGFGLLVDRTVAREIKQVMESE